MEIHDTSNPVRILIVDDHPNTATMLARVLSKFDVPVEVITASSGEDALAKIGGAAADRPDEEKQLHIDILITDFMMPGLNGLELIERLKGEQKPAHIILITAYDTPGLAITARRLNVQDYLVKPVQPEKIRTIVAHVIEELRPPSSRLPAPARRAFKILIADDYPDNLRLLSTRLQSEGYTFMPAWDGEETLRKVREDDPDLVLLDVNMPNKDGFQVLAEMRADPAIAHIPVIMITAARINPKDVREGLTLGADDYVIKPFDWRELAARIQSKLRVKQAEDILRRRTKELSILPEIGQQLSARLELDDLVQIVVNRTLEALEATASRLDIFAPGDKVFCCQRWAQGEQCLQEEITRQQATAWGLFAYAVASRQGAVVENVGSDKRWRTPDDVGIGSAVGVPLLGRSDVIGVLTLSHRQIGYFTEEHQTLLQAIASQAAIAIENAQLFSFERRRVQEMIALNQINQEINRFTHSQPLMENLPGLVKERLKGDGGIGHSEDACRYPVVAVWKRKNGNGSAPVEAGSGQALNVKSTLHLASLVGDSTSIDNDLFICAPQQAASSCRMVAWGVAAQGISQFPGSAIAVPLVRQNKFIATAPNAVAAAPQVIRAVGGEAAAENPEDSTSDESTVVEEAPGFGMVSGVLVVYSPNPDAFTESDCVLLETLATQVVSALERVELFESVEQEQRRLLAVLRSAADAILVLDDQMRLILANPAGEGLFPDTEPVQFEVLPSSYEGLINLLEKVHQQSKRCQGEVEWPDGRTFSVVVTPFEGGATAESGPSVAVLHDVSQFKALADLKNEYIATASHDLKNPLMSVLGFNDLLAKAGPLNPMQEDFSRRIRGSALQMRDLVLNLLEISRLESGVAMRLEILDLNALLEAMAHEHSEEARNKEQDLSLDLCPEQPRLRGDRMLLQQMVHNLVGNAIKYTPQGGKVSVSTRMEDHQVLIDFKDTGIGIPEHDLPLIFNKFYRVHTDETRDIEGTGLGLAIVKSIVENHSGHISVQSVQGEGTCFTVCLPVVEAL
jgi:signal transduction histidine kinase/CheY-like chemotaxis protein